MGLVQNKKAVLARSKYRLRHGIALDAGKYSVYGGRPKFTPEEVKERKRIQTRNFQRKLNGIPLNAPLWPNRKINPKQMPEIIRLGKSGATLREIGEKFHVSHERIRQLIKKYG